MVRILAILVFWALAPVVWASESGGTSPLHATGHPLAILALCIFILAYLAVMAEEMLHLRKSKPVMLAAGVIWALVATVAAESGVEKDTLQAVIGHNLVEYAALLLFLLVAMTYVNAMEERNLFEWLRSWLVRKGMGFRTLFWVTGWLAFFMSPVADNLTTALLLGAVIMAVGHGQPRFVSLGMINVVVAANAGGAYSPFGDITTLMVWQSGHLSFTEFFALFLPSVVNFLVPAIIMALFLPGGAPRRDDSLVPIKRGGRRIFGLFFLTIALAVTAKQGFGLPPFMGMMMGFALLMFFAYYLTLTGGARDDELQFDIFGRVARAEWDTLLFFFGVIFCVGGLAYLGFLQYLSHGLYDNWGPTVTNIAVGFISAVVDNIPVMYAILTMNPAMDQDQWLLVTMTAGVGGSLLSVGSAAGVALMGQARGVYTFVEHLKWSWAIGLGYVASIGTHFLVNG